MSGKYSCKCKHAHSLSIWISLTLNAKSSGPFFGLQGDATKNYLVQ